MLKTIQLCRNRSFLQIKNNYNIEDSNYYKQFKKNKVIDLTKKDYLYPSNGLLIIDNKPNDESIYIYQNSNRTKQSIFIFEGEDDIELFKSLLSAEKNIENSLDHISINLEDIIQLCIEQDFACLFYPEGSFVTPFNMKI